MQTINQTVLSEINGLPDTSQELKDFLIWVLGYEREHSDRRAFYKADIEKKLDELFLVGDKNKE